MIRTTIFLLAFLTLFACERAECKKIADCFAEISDTRAPGADTFNNLTGEDCPIILNAGYKACIELQGDGATLNCGLCVP